ncbi:MULTISPECIES: pore-forming ESAT-6 family protein [Paracoccus]|uniref:pore-forming ESAT-6 family protein n=1 Tax=Paracoccus TaxID=265 RepID=UPI0003B35D5C|nr:MULTISPECIES: pore-forming ESAT-6 family protein [Paracoccus]
MIRHFAVALGITLAAPAAFAQTAEAPQPTAEDAAANYEAARNQLGILQYCQEQGHTGPEAIETQGQLVGMLPAGDETAGQTAEDKGAEGTVAIAGQEMTLAEAAEGQGSTEAETCQQIEAAVNDIAESLPQG